MKKSHLPKKSHDYEKKIKRYLFLSIAMIFIGCMNNYAMAQEFNYKVNAMYIYYFTKYINWPDHSGSAFLTIGVLGDSPVTDQLKIIIAGKKPGSVPIIIKIIEISEVTKCQIIVVSKSQSSITNQVQEATRNLPILIVTEKRGLVKKGANICIYIDDEDNFKTKFEISKKNMQARKLKVANELLKIAEVTN
ncbi:MAG TPA: YfiR family protein [Chitinophagaceae bacterium]|nr:YfiR family protein [Chitinophagaceae bacterium]